jgi:RimJ/RimL family protein N-acetyltransferase
MSATPVLEGFGVRLEPINEQHIPALQAIAVEPSIWRYMPMRIETAGDLDALAHLAIAANSRDNAQVWVIRLATGEVIGSSRLFDLEPMHRTGEIGFSWLTAPHRGTGVNPRVKLLQLTHAFETLGLRRVALKTHHENLQSQQNILKLGAKFEGTFRNHMLMPDGTTRHTMWYSILDIEWPEVKERLLQRIAAQPLPPSP